MGKYKIDVDKLNSKINGNWFKKCPVCQEEETVYCESDLMQLTEFKSGGGSSTMSVVPLVVLTCSHCGNTILLNALALNLISRDEFIGETDDGTKLG